VVPMGCNISINCLSTLRCQRATYTILLNYTPAAGVLRPVNSTTFQLRLQDLRVPNWIVTCVARCPNSDKKELVCGTQVLAGYPPESPSNLSCAVHEHSERLACTWDAGKPTHLPTRYALHLWSVQTEEEAVFAAAPALAVPLSALRGGSRYSAWLQASNQLGTARSPQRRLDLQQLVIPALPVITGVETTEASPPTTLIRWEKRTRKENVRCEERYRAAGAPAWHVRAWAGGPGLRTRYALDSDTSYEFQVRCQLRAAGSPWSAWSSPFLYTTPEAGKRGVFLLATPRINTTIVSLMPKWLLEDFPHVENSNVIKSLQEKSEFARNSFSEPFLDNSDPTIMEIEEMSVHEEYKIVDIGKKHSKAVPEKAACLRSSVPAGSAATEPVSDYKPQLSDGNPLGYVAANIYQTQPHTLAPEPETNVFFRDYTSPITYLWNAEGTEQHAFLLEKINLILNNNRSGQNNAFDSAQEEQNTLLENQWEKTLSSENAQEQTLVPDELVSCLRTMNEESVDIKICFPQISLSAESGY
uniref:Interleukin 23 receptor n=1 Tax=Apteryx owenii TaxID=8824 RepID=A0A8B9SB09_APTOW